MPEVGAVMSAISYLPSLPQSGSLRDVTRRSVLRARLKVAVPSMIDQGWVAQSPLHQTWRITAKVSALSDEDYGALTSHVQNAVRRITADEEKKGTFSTEYTGLSPVMHETQMMLLKDFGASFTTLLS